MWSIEPTREEEPGKRRGTSKKTGVILVKNADLNTMGLHLFLEGGGSIRKGQKRLRKKETSNHLR